MLHRFPLFAFLVIAFVFPARAAQTPDETIAPVLNENTFLLIRFDLEKIDVMQIAKDLQKNIQDNAKKFGTDPDQLQLIEAAFQTGLDEVATPIRELVESLRKEGKAKELYIYTSTDFFNYQIPFMIAVPVSEEKAQKDAIGKIFEKAKFGMLEFPTRFARHGFYFAVPAQVPMFPGMQEYIDRMIETQKEGIRVLYRSLAPTARPEVKDAFAELAGDPIQLVLMRVPMFTTNIDMIPWGEIPIFQTESDEEDDSESSDPFGGKKGEPDSLLAKVRYELKEGISWTALGIDPQKPQARWIVKSKGKGGAKRTAETVDLLVDRIAEWTLEDAKYRGGNQLGQFFESKDELKSIITLYLPKPQPQKEILALTIDKAFVDTNGPKVEHIVKRSLGDRIKTVGLMQDSNNLKQIGLAIHNYHDVYQSLPSVSTADAKGKPLHSWRVAILPFIEQAALYDEIKFDEPWDSEHNKQFHDKMPPTYKSPFLKDEESKKGLTNYVMITGENGPFPGPNKWNNLGYFLDGTSNQIMVSERTKPVCWMDPTGDVDFEIAKKGINKDKDGLGSTGKNEAGVGGVNSLLGDGSVAFFPDTTDPKAVEKLINPRDGEIVEIPGRGFDTRPERPKKPVKPGKMSTMNNLKQLVLAMHTYHDAHNSFPSVYAETKEKKPLHSWRVAFLPYVEENALYDKIRKDEPWDSEYNKQFHNQMPAVYVSSGLTAEEIEKGNTTFAVVWGKKAAFQPNKWFSFGNITDGTSNTGCIFQRKTSFCWMDPTADIPFDAAIKGLDKDDKGIGVPDKDSKGKKGTYFAMFDGSVQFLPADTSKKVLEAIITPNDGVQVAIP